MLPIIITFAISFGIVSFMIGRRVTHIRSGKIVLDTDGFHPEAMLADFDFSSIRSSVSYYIRIYMHRIVLVSLKQWIRFSFWIKEQKEKRFPKKETAEGIVRGPSAFAQFVATFAEYKKHLKNVARKVKEREERKRE